MTDTSLVRRLTTILAIDVVAFSTMSARNEEHALALLTARLDSAGTLVRQHRGRVFKMTGDGLLAEFASPVEAVRAALEIQEAMRSANAGAQADDQLILRIGVNLGDVVESGDDLMGDAVNVAVRLGVDLGARRHLHLVFGLRADRRQADAGCRGYRRAARQEHPSRHPCLSPDGRRRALTGRRPSRACGGPIDAARRASSWSAGSWRS